MIRAVIFNGPPDTGKDYLVDALVQLDKTSVKLEFKKQLRALVKQIYMLTDRIHDYMYRRENKERPFEILGGLSIRQAYIKVSEEVIKPTFGSDYFGKCVVQDMVNIPAQTYYFSDGGFVDEIIPMLDYVGRVDIIHLSADGSDYEASGDSRRYIHIDHPKVFIHKLFNDKTPSVIDKLIQEIL